MTIHTLWPTQVLVEENFLPTQEHEKIRNFMYSEFKRQGTFPLVNFDHVNVPDELKFFVTYMTMAFHTYCVEANLPLEEFDLTNIQAHSIPKYNKQLSHEHIMEPHHDIGEGAYLAVVYYVDFDENETDHHFVGGELAIYRELSSMDYPDGIVHVKPKENKIAMFPARLVHRLKPYFGDKPRITIACLYSKERNEVQNKTIKTY
jgi:Rps23 Pro-64 3,4-dihydroxylase Tpa1-like proline 4-hydroxylase